MGNASRYLRCAFFLLALTFIWSAGLYAPYAAVRDHPPTAKPPELAAAMAKYRQELTAYSQAREAYQAAAKTYWSSIAEKRRLRNGKRARGAALSIDDYVLDQPPIYSGPPKPRDPSKPPEPSQPPPYVPVVADFLAAAVNEFKFTPRMPRNDGEFKRAYVAAAAAAGLSKDQVVRIYSFEATGNGTYDLEAGLEYNKNGRANPRRSATINCWQRTASRSSPKTASVSSPCLPRRRSDCRTTTKKPWRRNSPSCAK
jgi:hypothetical protein